MVAIVFADDMTRILVGNHHILSNDFCSKMAEHSSKTKKEAAVAALQH